ncbi:DsbA family protein [Chloroflexota bacterium]
MTTNKKSNAISIDVFFDFNCPYVYNAAIWLEKVKEDRGEKLVINWKYFSLEQANSQNGPDWKLWEQPEDYPSRGRSAFQAAEAARYQGSAAFNRFHIALLRARHEQKLNITNTSTLIEVARDVELEMPRFVEDLQNPKLLIKLAEDHTFAVESLGIFGTPTIVFSDGQVIFLKIMPAPPPEECSDLFMEILHLAQKQQYVLEIKRPTQPKK